MPAAKACHADGSAEYWFCPECDAVFADAAGTQLTNRKNLVIPAVLELTHVEKVAPTTEAAGMAEYWYCEDCEAVYADAEGKVLTNLKNLVIPAIETPNTGDNTSLVLLTVLLLVAAAGVAAVIVYKKRTA